MKRLLRIGRGTAALLTLLMAALMLLPSTTSPATAAPAAQGERCFSETGQCMAGAIRTYWESNGGLPVFGYPITAQSRQVVEGRNLQVQWFERDRLEIQADGSVTAGRLGARYLELDGRPWERGPGIDGSGSGCRYFPETGYNACGRFLQTFNANGGINRMGLPITDVFEEVIEGQTYLVQYFERRRMEVHPDGVKFGLLGVLVRQKAGQGNTSPVMSAAGG